MEQDEEMENSIRLPNSLHLYVSLINVSKQIRGEKL